MHFSGRGTHDGQAAMSQKKYRILVVDDERGIVATLAEILESRGYEAATAFSGEEAIRVACSFRPDCILSDVTMGAMNGIDASIEILRALPACKVLLVSGDAGYGDLLEKARAKGFDLQVLLKPVHPIELLTRIAQMLPGSGTDSKV